jgi:hypothetical protein
MKKILYTTSVFLVLLTACTNDGPNFNDNQDRSYDVPAETLLANAQRELSDQSTTPDVNLNPFRFYTQYLASTQYPEQSNYDVTTRTIPDNVWNNFYRDVLGNLESAKTVITGNADLDSATKKNELAIIEVLEVYTFQLLVDTFGDVPYSEALDPLNVLPKYDDDAEIYPLLITRLDAALADLDETAGSFTSGDVLLGGDIGKWKLFGNSLKVKIGINLADVNSALAKTTIESAVSSGVILTNNQNVTFNYSSAAPINNPIYAQIVASGRNDYVASSTIVNVLNGLEDPRREVYFQTLGGSYVGGVNGGANDYFEFSAPGVVFEQPDLPAALMEATEVNFYLAEAAARGYNVNGTPETYYETGIRTSFEYWQASGVDEYLTKPQVAYATAAGDWKQKIGNQEWIALFNRPFESWTAWRRLDVPQLTPAINPRPAADGRIPVRLTYPVNEQTVNNVNLQAAATAIGGNRLTTKIFWDAN